MDKDTRKKFNFFENKSLSKKTSVSQITKTENRAAATLFSESDSISPLLTSINSMTQDEMHHLIVNSVKIAKLEVGKKPQISDKRQAIIRKALEIQCSKEYVLEELSNKQRQKLRALALNIFKCNDDSYASHYEVIKKKKI